MEHSLLPKAGLLRVTKDTGIATAINMVMTRDMIQYTLTMIFHDLLILIISSRSAAVEM